MAVTKKTLTTTKSVAKPASTKSIAASGPVSSGKAVAARIMRPAKFKGAKSAF